MFFSAAKRLSVKGDLQKKKRGETPKVTEIAKELGKRWRGMSVAAKKPYNDMAKRDKKRYLSAKAKAGK